LFDIEQINYLIKVSLSFIADGHLAFMPFLRLCHVPTLATFDMLFSTLLNTTVNMCNTFCCNVFDLEQYMDPLIIISITEIVHKVHI